MDKQEMQQMLDAFGSLSALARHLGVPIPTLRSRVVRLGITPKTKGYQSPKAVSHRGQEHHAWKGGTLLRSDGYVYEYAPDHPASANSKGYVLQHRLVMERHLGRLLAVNELVHHVNEIKTDNRIENLELTSRSAHMKYHKGGAARDDSGRFE